MGSCVERSHIGKNVWPYLSVEEMDVLKINGDDDDVKGIIIS